MKERFKNISLVKKMVLIYALMLGGCLLFCLLALRISFNIYDEKLYEKSLQELDYFIQKVDQSLDEVEDISFSTALDMKIQESLSAMQTMRQFTAEYSREVYTLRMVLGQEQDKTDIIENISYMNGKTKQIDVGIYKDMLSKEEYEKILEELHKAKGAYVVFQPTEEYPYLISGRDILKYLDSSLDYLGSILITSDVAGLIEKYIDQLEAESAALCVFYNDQVIYESDENMHSGIPALEGGSGYRILELSGQRYFLCHLVSAKTGWTYVNMFPYTEIYGQNQMLRTLLLVGFVAIFVITGLILRKLVFIIGKPLEQLTESMLLVEDGDFKGARAHLGEEVRGDEIGLLTQEFRVSLDKIDNLIHENYEKQILLKDTRYKMLQAQINPHFLYNTLNSIHWMIRSGKNKEAAEMTVALGEILRAALSKTPYVTIEEELYTLKKYIMIQEYRYQKRAVFLVEEDGDAKPYRIPHMTLQPLVENAIYHCVDKMLTPCTIQVKIKAETDTLLIEVQDNGPGMSAEELKEVRTFQQKKAGHGIGLKNIYERLKMAFDQKMVFEIESALGKGTAIRIVIPKQEVEQGEVQGNSGG